MPEHCPVCLLYLWVYVFVFDPFEICRHFTLFSNNFEGFLCHVNLFIKPVQQQELKDNFLFRSFHFSLWCSCRELSLPFLPALHLLCGPGLLFPYFFCLCASFGSTLSALAYPSPPPFNAPARSWGSCRRVCICTDGGGGGMSPPHPTHLGGGHPPTPHTCLQVGADWADSPCPFLFNKLYF